VAASRLGARIAELRHARGLSQPELAKQAGISKQYVSKLERLPSVSPSADILERLADRLGTTMADLLEAQRGDEGGRGDAGNVAGRLEELRGGWVRPLPVYRWGAAGDPRDDISAPDPDRIEHPPVGQELRIGPRGFGVVVRGSSMVSRNINDGDTVWVNLQEAARLNRPVLAVVADPDGESGMLVKVLKRDAAGDYLVGDESAGEEPVRAGQFSVVGPVVWVSPAGHPPG
jgi:transcriptional regulator with XRE-family HTH domain